MSSTAVAIQMPSVFPVKPEPVSIRQHIAVKDTTPDPAALTTGLDQLQQSLATLFLAQQQVAPNCRLTASAIGKAYRFASVALTRVATLMDVLTLQAWRQFEMRLREHMPMQTEREQIAAALSTHMLALSAWEKAGEWIVDDGLFSKIRGVRKEDGVQNRLRQLNQWAERHPNPEAAYRRVRVSLVADNREGVIRVFTHDNTDQPIRLGWLNPKYAQALLPLVESGRLSCRISEVREAQGIFGCNIRLDIIGITADPVATFEVNKRRVLDEKTAEMNEEITTPEPQAERVQRAYNDVHQMFHPAKRA